MVEAALAIAMLVLGLLGMSQAVSGSLVTSRQSQEASIATDAARVMLEALSTEDFATIFARYNDTELDDPVTGPAARGAGFEVDGLQALEGDDVGLAGEIMFPTADAVGGGLELREDIDLPGLNMPRDLTGDGVIDALDHSTDYQTLPVMVRVRWRSASGPALVELKTILADL